MRKPRLVLLAAMVTLTVSACDTSDGDPYGHIDFESDTYTIEDGVSVTHYRIGAYLDGEDGMEEHVRLFDSHASFSAYRTDIFESADEGFEDIEFAEYLGGITSDYFDDKNLILLYLVEESGANSHRVRRLDTEGGSVVANVLRRTPEVGTDDMAYWTILIEGDKDSLSGEKAETAIESYTP